MNRLGFNKKLMRYIPLITQIIRIFVCRKPHSIRFL